MPMWFFIVGLISGVLGLAIQYLGYCRNRHEISGLGNSLCSIASGFMIGFSFLVVTGFIVVFDKNSVPEPVEKIVYSKRCTTINGTDYCPPFYYEDMKIKIVADSLGRYDMTVK